jgi:VanZ family protein
VRCGVLLAWMLAISYWSHQSKLPIDQPEVAQLLMGLQHKLSHLIGFGGLGLIAVWALQGVPRVSVVAVVLACAFGALDEWHQSFVPGRKPGVEDWVFDTVSAALAIWCWTRMQRLSRSVSVGQTVRLLTVRSRSVPTDV